MRELSKRLQVIYDLVPMSSKVADIGTDHAYLPIALSLNGKAQSVIACDINESPLKKAEENLKKSGASKVDLRLGDGISPVKENEVDTIIIAGMGGDVIRHILSLSDWIKNPDVLLLLQPMTSAELLRTYLTDNLFEIKKEVALIDTSKLYSVMAVRYKGIKKAYEKGYEYIGEVTNETNEGRLYIEKQQKRIKNCLKDIEKVSYKADETKNLKEILSYIEKVLEK